MTTTQPAPGTASARPGAQLEARNLTRHFTVSRGIAPRGRRDRDSRAAHIVHAVDDVSMMLAPGSITALVGESGSGKSTLARLLARLVPPSSGDCCWTGSRCRPAAAAGVTRYARDRPARAAGPVLLAEPRARRAVPPGPAAAGPGHLPAGPVPGRGHPGLLERVALTPASQFIRKYPHELSGGQRQRVAIARALAVQPRVLLADEPVSMLDVSIRLGVLNLLADLRENDGLTILYITHDIASARYLSDDIAVMYAGEIVESGPAVHGDRRAVAPLHPAAAVGGARPGPAARAIRCPARGGAPSLMAPPSGCRFHPRCPHAMAICSAQAPPAARVAPGHVSSCWLHSPEQAARVPSHRLVKGVMSRRLRSLTPPDPSPRERPRPAGSCATSTDRPRHGHSKKAGDSRPGKTEHSQ